MTVLFYTHVISYFYITGPRQYKKIMSKWRFKYCFFLYLFYYFCTKLQILYKIEWHFCKTDMQYLLLTN